MPVEIPTELQEKLDRLTHMRERFTEDEFTGHLLTVIARFVDQEASTAPREGIDLHAIKAQQDALVLATATAIDVPNEFLAIACRASPPGTDAGLDRAIGNVLGSVCSQTDLDGGRFEVAYAWLDGGGDAPPNLVAATQAAEPLTAEAALTYLIARNRGDTATQERVVASDLDAGCPATLVMHLDSTAAIQPAVEQALANVERSRWQTDGRWGDITSVAVFLAERGWLHQAHEWAGVIVDDRVPAMIHIDLTQQHHPVFGSVCKDSNDATVFAPLALIDYLAGDHHRAAIRADRGNHPGELASAGHSWILAAHRSLTAWVASRVAAEPNQRRALLKSITPRHTWLGLLRAQIDSDLADLAAADGDIDRERELRESAADALQHPRVSLHLGWFPYDRLLRQLPYPMREWPSNR